jgi:cephalosporin-C deacetylase-like acetyl esterase
MPARSDLSLAVFTAAEDRELARVAFPEFLAKREAEAAVELDAEIAQLASPADVRRFQRKARRKLADLLGPFPDRTALRPKTTGVVERSGVRIEKVLFESRPDYPVTANVYIPMRHPLPAPGVLLPCGHSKNGKAARGYHRAGMGLALKGYVAMIYDPTGQGERSECFDARRGNWVRREVPQHHYTGKPCFLTGLTLAGWRTWDGIRCLDYLCGRDDVDAERIGVLGCSGGGAMTMLISCIDERVVACAPSHPGGSMENTQLNGRRPPDRLIYSLLAPRPCRIIVGKESGETGHLDKLALLKPFYEACGCPERLEFEWVAGGHDMNLPKRAPSYEWLGRWLGHFDATRHEPPFRPCSEKTLYCTKTGQVLTSIRGATTMQKQNATRAAQLAPDRSVPKAKTALRKRLASLRRAVRKRIRFEPCTEPLHAHTVRIDATGGGQIEALLFESEPGIPVPASCFVPEGCRDDAPVVLHVRDAGKPTTLRPAPLPLRLMQKGLPVLSIDVRDTGETSLCEIDTRDMWPPRTRNWRNFNGSRWSHDALAIRAWGVGRTRSGMRVLDVLRAVDLLGGLDDFRARPVVAVGEGRGGVWVLKAAAFDQRIAAVAAVRMLGSYRRITDNAEYNQFEHFFVPGALLDYDLPDLPALVAPRSVMLLDAVDHMSERLSDAATRKTFAFARDVYAAFGAADALTVARTAGPASLAKRIAEGLGAPGAV